MGLNICIELITLTKSLKLSHFDLQQPCVINEAETHLYFIDEETETHTDEVTCSNLLR